ncbi:MAG: TolB family protein [Gemmatimonadales bacterium]
MSPSSNIVQLTMTGGLAPSWSPDGTRIAVGTKASGDVGAPAAFVMNAADGGNVVPLVPGADPAWSPDGSRIALSFCPLFAVCDPDDNALAFIDPDGSGLTTPPGAHGVYQPAWSRDGARLAVRLLPTRDAGTGGGSWIYSVSPDGTGYVLLSGPADHLPAWGP